MKLTEQFQSRAERGQELSNVHQIISDTQEGAFVVSSEGCRGYCKVCQGKRSLSPVQIALHTPCGGMGVKIEPVWEFSGVVCSLVIHEHRLKGRSQNF
ncbi:hypothetical protein [Deinococcus koreensis]|uniref:hypothetical protein n=1 Tax=Deinococcus koreensis TaxID=2054903 RepID=UPI001056EBC1|nr:hypothetical protein [Deinococcus koreensis]